MNDARFVLLILLSVAVVGVPAAGHAAEESTPSLLSAVNFDLYGYVKLDSAWDTGRAIPGNYVKWISRVPLESGETEHNVTINETRVGIVAGNKDDDDLRVSGRFEIDFYGGGADDSPEPRMRQGYVRLEWPRSRVDFLVGQTGDVISPLFPRTLNYPVAWWAGNIGFRRLQVRVGKAIEAGVAYDFRITGAISRDIRSDRSVFGAINSDAVSAQPALQMHLGWVKKNRLAGPLSIGISGHYSEEEFEIDPDGTTANFDSWSANLDAEIPISKRVKVKGELFKGENLSQYLGGIVQGVNLAKMTEIGSQGGWISLDLLGFHKIAYHLGASTERVDLADVEVGARTRNSSMFANGIWTVHRHVDLGLELSYWRTAYKEESEADSFRTQLAVIYRF